MSTSTKGVLVVCEGAMREYIKYIEEQELNASGGGSSFVISELDERHIMVKEYAVELIKKRVDELQAKNTFTRDTHESERAEAEARLAAEQEKKKRKQNDNPTKANKKKS